jgi:hypothetical protein
MIAGEDGTSFAIPFRLVPSVIGQASVHHHEQLLLMYRGFYKALSKPPILYMWRS